MHTGAVFAEFLSLKNAEDGFGDLSHDESAWLTMVSYIMALKVQRVVPQPQGRLRNLCYTVVMHPFFERLIILAILVNTIELIVWWYGMPETWISAKEGINLFLYGCYLVCCMGVLPTLPLCIQLVLLHNVQVLQSHLDQFTVLCIPQID
jgi:hypothetical protein